MAGTITLCKLNNEARIEWKINHFFIREDNLIVSPDFILFKSKWFLQLHLGSTFLKSFSNAKDDYWEPLRMSLLTLNPTTEYHIEYRMGIQACNGSDITTEKFESVLNKGFCQTPQRRELISRKDFENSRKTLVTKNTLTVFCTVFLISAVNPPPRDVSSPIPSTDGDLSSSLLLFCDEENTAGEITLVELINETRIEWQINDFFIRRNRFLKSPHCLIFNSKFFLQIEKYKNIDPSLIMSLVIPYPEAKFYIEYTMGIQMSDGSEIKTKTFDTLLESGVNNSLKGHEIISSTHKRVSHLLVSENTLKVFCTVSLLSKNNSRGNITLLDNFVSSRYNIWNGTLVGKLTLDTSKKETNIEWTIYDFSTRKETLLKSPDFTLFKSNWFLYIANESFFLPAIRYDMRNPSENSLRMCIQRDCHSTAEHHIEYRMGINRPDGSKMITEKFESVFQPRFKKTFPGRELVSEKDLKRLRNTLTHGETLKVFCTVRFLNDGNPVEDVQPAIASTYESGALYERFRNIMKANRTLNTNVQYINLTKDISTQTENSEVPWLPKTDCNVGGQFKGTATSSGSSENVCLNKGIHTLSENLKDLYQSKRFTDVTIKVQDKEFLVHKTILSTRSEVFASMFEHDTSEKRNKVIDITDCDPHSFENFLLYLYTGKLDTVWSSNASSLYKTADKYGVEELRDECVRCMSREMTVGTFCDIFHLAVLHGESSLLTAATNFFVRNASAILITKEWLTLLEEHASPCNELLVKFAKSCSGLHTKI